MVDPAEQTATTTNTQLNNFIGGLFLSQAKGRKSEELPECSAQKICRFHVLIPLSSAKRQWKKMTCQRFGDLVIMVGGVGRRRCSTNSSRERSHDLDIRSWIC